MKKNIAIFICLVVLFCTSIFAYSVSYIDIEGHWALNYIETLSSDSVINGYPDRTYRPENTITRGEFLKLIMTASLGSETFEGANWDDHWTTPYVNMARRYNVLMTEVTLNNVDEPITRLEMAVILAYSDIEFVRGEKEEGELDFSDISGIHEWYLELLGHTVERQLLNGYPDGTYRPNNYVTRAEAATVIYRYLEYGV